jgi:hypothetical protein
MRLHRLFPDDMRGSHPTNPAGVSDAELVLARSRKLQRKREAAEAAHLAKWYAHLAPAFAGRDRWQADCREYREQRALARVARLLAYPTPTGLKLLTRLATDPEQSELVRVRAAMAILKLGDQENG